MESQELETLKKEIKNLRQELQNQKSNISGRTYSSFGSSNSDFLIKTKGQVKIQWGSKYIDLIKDGKINANFKFIYQTDKVGTKDGIYVVGENKDVILVIDGNSITLSSQGGNTYVSFQDIQTADSDQKHTALKNIGLIYENYSDVEQAQIKNGIVYVESEKKLYTILNGVVSEFSVSIPNPYTQQFVIAKNDSKNGALVIKGTGLTNSVLFNTSYIYEEDFRLVLNTPSGLYIKLGDNYKIKVENDTVLFTDKITAPFIQSSNASSDYGYRLYMQNGQSTLEVDNIIVRNADISNQNTLYPTTWNYNNNIISSIQQQDNQYNITLKYENTFKVGSQLYVYLDTKLSNQDITYNSLYIISFIIQSIDQQSIIVTLSDTIDSEIYNDFNSYFSLLTNQTIFEIGNTESIRLVRQSKDGLDLLESTGINDEKTLSNVKTRIGDLTNLGLKGKLNNDEVSIEGLGVYSSNGVFDSVQYSKDYNLPYNDNSSKLASTEWVHKLLPAGSIIMFSGQSPIPDGWAVCDGNNGTPNLIGKFIKASDTSGSEGGQSSIQLSVENLPSHTHTFPTSQISTSTNGAHTHTYTQLKYGGSEFLNAVEVEATVSNSEEQTSESGNHFHTIDLSNVYLSNVGDNKPLEWEPTFYSLIFIMKLPI